MGLSGIIYVESAYYTWNIRKHKRCMGVSYYQSQHVNLTMLVKKVA